MGFTRTSGSPGNISAAASLAASASRTVTVDFTTVGWGVLVVGCLTGGTVAASAGLQFTIFEGAGSTPEYDTVGSTYVVPATAASTQTARAIELQQGLYKLTMTNLDASNAVTPHATSDTYA